MTALAQIFAEIDTRLQAVDGVEEYQRMPSGDPAKFNALHVFDGGDDSETPEGSDPGTTRLDLRFQVIGYVEGGSGAAAHDALSALHADTVKALCADTGFNLGGLVESIEVVGQRDVDVAELASKRRLAFAQDFGINYATARGDPNTLLS